MREFMFFWGPGGKGGCLFGGIYPTSALAVPALGLHM